MESKPMALKASLSDLERKLLIAGEKGLCLADRVAEAVVDFIVSYQMDSIATTVDQPVFSIDDIEQGPVALIDNFFRTVKRSLNPAAIRPVDTSRFDASHLQEPVAVDFVYRLRMHLDSRFDYDELIKLVVKIASSSSHCTAGSARSTVKIDVPGWVTDADAQNMCDQIYWFVPLTLLHQASYSEYTKRITLMLADWPWPERIAKKRKS